MTDYLDFTPTEYEVGAPATSLHFERWFRNGIAMAEGAPGAPRFAMKPLAVASNISKIGLGGYQGCLFIITYSLSLVGSDSAFVTIKFSNDGVSFSSAIPVASLAGTDTNTSGLSVVHVDFETGDYVGMNASGNLADMPENPTHFRVEAYNTSAGSSSASTFAIPNGGKSAS